MLLFFQTLLNLIKKPIITFLLTIQIFIVLGQFYQAIIEYNFIQNQEQVLLSLTESEETLIMIEAMTSKEELNDGRKRSEIEIENILHRYSDEYNKFFIAGVLLEEKDTAAIIPADENYQYLLEDSYTEVTIVQEPIKGNLILTEGENFLATDFQDNGAPYPVLLGEGYKHTHKIGDTFEVDMTTGSGLGKFSVKVKGFIKSRSIQPILTEYTLNSTQDINNYFVIAIPPTVEHPIFQASSFLLIVNEQEQQQLQQEIYQMEDNYYYINDILAPKKQAAGFLKDEKRGVLINMVFNCIILGLTFYLIIKQQFISNKFEYAVLRVLGHSSWFNVLTVLLQYLTIFVSAVLIWELVILLKGNFSNLIRYNLLTVAIVFIIVALSIIPILKEIYFQPVAEHLKEER